MTYKEIIIKVLEESGDWIPSYKFVNARTDYGWLGKSGDRRARELFNAGVIDRRINHGYVEYKFIPKRKVEFVDVGNNTVRMQYADEN